jgi:hypothetical protein
MLVWTFFLSGYAVAMANTTTDDSIPEAKRIRLQKELEVFLENAFTLDFTSLEAGRNTWKRQMEMTRNVTPEVLADWTIFAQNSFPQYERGRFSSVAKAVKTSITKRKNGEYIGEMRLGIDVLLHGITWSEIADVRAVFYETPGRDGIVIRRVDIVWQDELPPFIPKTLEEGNKALLESKRSVLTMGR